MIFFLNIFYSISEKKDFPFAKDIRKLIKFNNNYTAKHLENPLTTPIIKLCTQLFLCLQKGVLFFLVGQISIRVNFFSIIKTMSLKNSFIEMIVGSGVI